MAIEKPTYSYKKSSKSPIPDSLSYLFYVSKIFGLIPYSMSDYITKRQFKLSQFGNILCILSSIHYIIQFHVLTSSSMFAEKETIGALTMVIGVFIIYLEPFMMTIDVLASMINQTSLLSIFDRLRDIDEKLDKENISLKYKVLRKYSIILMCIAFVGEVTLGIFNLFVFQTDFISLYSLWWLISTIPLLINSVARIWFLVLILLVQQRLRAINEYINTTKKLFFQKKIRHLNAIGSTNQHKDDLFLENIGYLEREIFSTRKMQIKDNNWNWATNRVNDINHNTTNKSRGIIHVLPHDGIKKGEGKLYLLNF